MWEDGVDTVFNFGIPYDTPVVGAWQQGATPWQGGPPQSLQIGVFRSSDGYWALDWNGNHLWDSEDQVVAWGQPGDIPVVGDWHHTGRLQIGIVRNIDGSLYWYVNTSPNCGNPAYPRGCDFSNTPSNNVEVFQWGQAGDIPVIGNWSGNGYLSIGVFRPGNNTWYLNADPTTNWSPQWNGSSWYLYNNDYSYQLQNGYAVSDVFNPFSQYGNVQIAPVAGCWSGPCTGYPYLTKAMYYNGMWRTEYPNYYFPSFGVLGDIPVMGPWNTISITPNPNPLPSGVVGTPYSATFTAGGNGSGSYTWSITPTTSVVPPGLQLAPNGTLSGRPSQANTYTFTVQVTDNYYGFTASQQYNLSVSNPVPFAVGAIQSPPPLQQWGPASKFTVQLSSVAPGVTVGVTGQLSGCEYMGNCPSVAVFPDPPTLSQSGTFNVQVVASDAAPTGYQSLQLTFLCSGTPACLGYYPAAAVSLYISPAKTAGYFTLETNLSAVGLDDYLKVLSQIPQGIQGCNSAWTYRQCFNSAFNNDPSSPYYQPNNYLGQEVTGVRFFFPAYYDVAGERNHAWDINNRGALTGGPNGVIDTFWANLNTFLKDLRSYGVRYVTPTIALENYGVPAPTAAPGVTSQNCGGGQLYFYPFFPFGYVNNGNGGYWPECPFSPIGYANGAHPPAGLFWGWETAPGMMDGPYYKLLDKLFQAVQDAQLQVAEFDINQELQLENFPVTARLIQDNGPQNELSQNVYNNICAIMSRHHFTGKNGECLATYSTQAAADPPQDCTTYYGDSVWLLFESSLMHAFAGDYFGGLYTFVSPPNSCVQLTGDLPGAHTLAAPDELVSRTVVDLHASISNDGVPDPAIATTFFNDVYSLLTSRHNTIIPGLPAFSMPLTAPYPFVMGETFSTQTQQACPNLNPAEWDLSGGAQAEFTGYLSSNLYSLMGAHVIFRPWHWIDPNCPTPSQIGPPFGPYRPYSSQ